MVSSPASPHKLDDQAKQILVQLDDGSTWKAEQRIDGLYLIEQLTDPSGSSSSTAESEPAYEPAEEEMEPTPSEDEEASESESDEPTADEVDAYERMFESPPMSKSVAEILNSAKDVRGIPEELKGQTRDPAFRARLSSIMLDNKYDRKLRGRTRGKLDMGRLPKVPMMQRNVFMRKQSRKGKAYNVLLLVDESGSMGGSKSRAAAEATVFLLSQLDGLNITTAVIGFNEMIAVHKSWDGKSDYDLIYTAVKEMGYVEPWSEYSNNGSNNDYDALHYGYEYFKKAPHGENILIMLSDGEPATSYREPKFVDEKGNLDKKFKFNRDLNDSEKDQKEHLHHLVASYPHIHSVGIGIMEGGWQIPEHSVIHNLADLKKTIVKALGNKIKRG